MKDTNIKEYILTVIIIAFFASLIYFSINTPPLKYRVERVRIDSISVSNSHSVSLDKTWTFYTKYGATITSSNEVYKVGDSVDVKIVKLNQ